MSHLWSLIIFWHDDLLTFPDLDRPPGLFFQNRDFQILVYSSSQTATEVDLNWLWLQACRLGLEKRSFTRFRDSRFRKFSYKKFLNIFLIKPRKCNLVWIGPVQHFWYWSRQKYLWGHLHICFELLLKPSCQYSLFKVKYTRYFLE